MVEIVTPSSADWDETRLTCPEAEEGLPECIAASADAPRIVLLGPEGAEGKVVLGARIVDGSDVDRAVAQPGAQPGGDWVVVVELTPEGTAAFRTATEAALGSRIAVIVDGRIVSSPVVAAPITSGDVVVTGGLTEREARSLASELEPAPA